MIPVHLIRSLPSNNTFSLKKVLLYGSIHFSICPVVFMLCMSQLGDGVLYPYILFLGQSSCIFFVFYIKITCLKVMDTMENTTEAIVCSARSLNVLLALTWWQFGKFFQFFLHWNTLTIVLSNWFLNKRFLLICCKIKSSLVVWYTSFNKVSF